MTSATIKVLLSHLLRVSLDTGCRLQNHLFQGVQLLPFLLEMNITYWKYFVKSCIFLFQPFRFSGKYMRDIKQFRYI